MTANGSIDFNDMIWLPVVLNLPMFRYDVLLVDEQQDLNKCQQQLAIKAGKRLILCGDKHQAIYGFAGADSESMDRMYRILSSTPVGCDVLPLTVTRRCGAAIVERAKAYVPAFEAHPENGPGAVETAYIDGYHDLVKDGDLVISRVNAPLVSQCFRFLRQGRKANIIGRNVAEGLKKLIKKLDKAGGATGKVTDLIPNLGAWLSRERAVELALENPRAARLIALEDKYNCVLAFTEGATDSVEDMLARIDRVFVAEDGEGNQVQGVRLSSIHRAKGLEARQVFFIRTEDAPCPHPMARTPWQQEQENNCMYIALTRALEKLIFVV